jgi:hypothetical protein
MRGCELVEVLDNAGFDEGKLVPSIVSAPFPWHSLTESAHLPTCTIVKHKQSNQPLNHTS